MNKRAFTLVEVMFSLAIFAGLFLIMFGIITSGNQIYSGVMASMELRQNARNAMDRIVREVRESNSSAVTADPYDPDSRVLIFWGPRYKDAGGVLQPIKYSLASGQILREFPPNTVKPVAVDVARLYFNKSGSQLDIQIKVGKTVGNRPMEFLLDQKVRMRNE